VKKGNACVFKPFLGVITSKHLT